ncbi:hypothetical protein NDU88_007014 [Pleurodeles waltl]|uniref:Uncharacterized protein n=1 Tax=Pleurodeles waltl TaxID=8319 RepID=A0AAV7VRJ3_PLEWA|nr:hypothetical protein NDU88_007014 [Pleurodeles waltl]
MHDFESRHFPKLPSIYEGIVSRANLIPIRKVCFAGRSVFMCPLMQNDPREPKILTKALSRADVDSPLATGLGFTRGAGPPLDHHGRHSTAARQATILQLHLESGEKGSTLLPACLLGRSSSHAFCNPGDLPLLVNTFFYGRPQPGLAATLAAAIPVRKRSLHPPFLNGQTGQLAAALPRPRKTRGDDEGEAAQEGPEGMPEKSPACSGKAKVTATNEQRRRLRGEMYKCG